MTRGDALVDVGIAFLQVEFSIKLLSHCELDRIRPAEFDTHQVVLLERESLAFPTGRFSTQEEIIRAAMVAVLLALAGSALTLDNAWNIAGIRRDPHSAGGAVKLRMLVHMVLCACAHGVADPKWEMRGDYRQVLELDLASGALRLDFARASWPEFRLRPARGHASWFGIRDASLAVLA